MQTDLRNLINHVHDVLDERITTDELFTVYEHAVQLSIINCLLDKGCTIYLPRTIDRSGTYIEKHVKGSATAVKRDGLALSYGMVTGFPKLNMSDLRFSIAGSEKVICGELKSRSMLGSNAQFQGSLIAKDLNRLAVGEVDWFISIFPQWMYDNLFSDKHFCKGREQKTKPSTAKILLRTLITVCHTEYDSLTTPSKGYVVLSLWRKT